MPRKKKQSEPQEEERWVSVTEARDILQANSGRDPIDDPIDIAYVRTLAYPRRGKPPIVASKSFDGRTKVYRYSDLKNYVVGRRDKGKGDTKAAREAGSRRKSNVSEQAKEEATA